MPCSAPGLHQRVPHVLAVRGGEVDLVADLADEPDAQDQARHAGDVGLLGVQVLESLGRAVEIGQLAQDLPGSRTGQVDRGEALGHVGQPDVHPPVGQPPREPLLDRAGAARGRGHVVRVLVDPADRPVVDDPAGVGADHAVADPAGLEVGEAIGIEAVEELAGRRPADQQLAERRDVDQPGGLVDGERLLLRIAVVVGAPPVAGPLDVGAQLTVAAVDRRALGRLERPAGQHAHRDRHVRGASGRSSDALQALARLLRHQPHRCELAHPALARAHGHRRVALGQLDRVVALVDAQLDVLGGDVLAQAREALAAGRRRRREAGRRPVFARAAVARQPRRPARRRRCRPARSPERAIASGSSKPATSPAA